MAAATAKPARLPKGVGRVPQWWMEITPHNTLYIEDDEARRHAEEEEAKMYAKLAARDDMLQKYGGEGFPDWDPAEHGPRTPEEEEEWNTTGYVRNSDTGKWENESGEPLTGRQFEGKLPPGYIPGEFTGGDGGEGGEGGGFGQGQLNSGGGQYASDEKKQWSQPSWMKKKLRSTKNSSGSKSPKKSAPEPGVEVEETVEEAGGGAGGSLKSTSYDYGANVQETKIDSDLQSKMEARRAREESGASAISTSKKVVAASRLDSDLEKMMARRRAKEAEAEKAVVEEEEGITTEEIVEEVTVEE